MLCRWFHLLQTAMLCWEFELSRPVRLRTSAVANFCKDTGDFYAAEWKPFAAWQAWDLGRLMTGHVAGDLLDSIDMLESKLTTDQPSLF